MSIANKWQGIHLRKCFEFQILTVELNRGWNSRLGFSLQSDANTKNTFISAIYSDSVAARDGRLKIGDQVLMVSFFFLVVVGRFFSFIFHCHCLNVDVFYCFHRVKQFFFSTLYISILWQFISIRQSLLHPSYLCFDVMRM